MLDGPRVLWAGPVERCKVRLSSRFLLSVIYSVTRKLEAEQEIKSHFPVRLRLNPSSPHLWACANSRDRALSVWQEEIN